jgi:hypothetical protein
LRYGVALIGAVVGGFMLAGCGGSSSSKSSDVTPGRFEQHGFEITFR